MSLYFAGQLVTFRSEWTNSAGALTDPDSSKFELRGPDGSVRALGRYPNGDIAREAVGKLKMTFTVDMAGLETQTGKKAGPTAQGVVFTDLRKVAVWIYRWEATFGATVEFQYGSIMVKLVPFTASSFT